MVFDKLLRTGIPLQIDADNGIFGKSQNCESEIDSSATANLVHIARDHSWKVVRDAGDAYAQSRDI